MRSQCHAKPDRPDPLFAKKLQEVLGGAWGEITVSMQYLFQYWSCRAPAKCRDMLADIGTEELAHVEMLSVMIAQLLEGAPLSEQEDAVARSPGLASIMGGMNPQHAPWAGWGRWRRTRTATRGSGRTSWRAGTCWRTSARTSRPRATGGCR